jgi:hypothetical protein
MIKRDIEALSRKYPDWVIVPGTIYHGDKSDALGGKYAIRNDGLIAQDGHVKVVPKKYEADNLERDEVWAEQRTSDSRFESDGCKYATEVCRDHKFGAALTESRDLVDVHLITSNNVDFSKSSVVARDGGLVVWTDGNGDGKTTVFRVNWTKDPDSPEIRKLRDEIASDYAEVDAIDAAMSQKQAEINRLEQQRGQIKALRDATSNKKKRAALEAERLDKTREIDARAQDIATLAARYKVLTDRRKKLEAHITTTPLYSQGGDPDQRFELEEDRYAK